MSPRALKMSDVPLVLRRKIRANSLPDSEVSAQTKLRRKKARLLNKAKADAIRAAFRLLCKENGLPIPSTEFIFDESPAKRKFAFDYAWIPEKVALEVDGGIWVGGAHGRGSGIMRDQEKRNLATVQGWAVYHCVPKALQSPETIDLLRRALSARSAA